MTRRRYYLEDVALDEAIRRFETALERVGGLRLPLAEVVALAEACGRLTAGPVWAALSSPHYHAAAMDGIAVRAADTLGATESQPLQLTLGTQAIWVDTGDPMPPETDAVIMAEHVQTLDETTLEIAASVAPWQHVRPLGEDLVATELVLPEGHLLRPVDLGALAAAGHATVAVRRRPRVAIIATGTELVTVEEAAKRTLEPGEIIEFNALMLAGMVNEWGGEATRLPPVPDRKDLLRATVAEALDTHDLVVVNAGSSAGSEDYTATVFGELGEVAVHGVAIRPGHPAILAVANGKPALGLPGYPVSAALTAELFLRPLVYRLQGMVAPKRPVIEATMSRKLLSPLGEDEFVRVALGRVDDRLIATPLSRGAGLVMSLVRADGIAHIPRFAEGVHAGASVNVTLLRDAAEIEGTLVAIGSHDLALDLLASHMRRLAPGTRLSSANVGSLGGLLALKRRDAHLAGTHLLDEATGIYNSPFIERLLPDEEIVLVHLAYREQGFLVPRGNPQGFAELRDLARPGVRFANRQKGSGTRVLLDYHLNRAGLSSDQIIGYEREEFTHMAVAAAVMSASASVGLGILAAARALGLDFVPLFSERYDLAIPRRHWQSPLLEPLRRTLADPAYQAAVAALGGYDVRHMGVVGPKHAPPPA
ncbi:molybdopterin biosynthesis protein [Candidatus Chloroploca sp. M-50]|uniref:Molybdopterin molybdenumtransferase n=1 Tax=Candidatus Chloroploca mongolica TaxID=2528176 RepID=A0ABS4DFR1_9CHLR|nr:molybdopterin biosynthesis protein [Candidatus Chloroploca mongolica]MBP1468288.1 molybdopterin biosynthesis protein [Candidatus Chloroploca mongolica]